MEKPPLEDPEGLALPIERRLFGGSIPADTTPLISHRPRGTR
jgi:hypothetical protein